MNEGLKKFEELMKTETESCHGELHRAEAGCRTARIMLDEKTIYIHVFLKYKSPD